ncbi:hypothetical protein DOE76_12680 [Leifsonia sp. ku-ls]|nr:hypothetical protein DOE76_12680 [Leifsonia sp. ku-ls]
MDAPTQVDRHPDDMLARRLSPCGDVRRGRRAVARTPLANPQPRRVMQRPAAHAQHHTAAGGGRGWSHGVPPFRAGQGDRDAIEFWTIGRRMGTGKTDEQGHASIPVGEEPRRPRSRKSVENTSATRPVRTFSAPDVD